ncbi:hypothetical protein LRS73_33880 (plasmid) [Methylobacterium currus]|uniref:hypothetical protein n=1 Tax=Methylobacterium currus TaxID=2051553 RepID=UPI001E442D38|nr:hypothetical protein [Methylobacterium currus]UHC19973.1 hypothetical protein LRS73_33880 [Methylobacterium currus]
MPTDLPCRRQQSRPSSLSTLPVAIVGLRLRLHGRRIEQDFGDRDHIKFLQHLNAWVALRRYNFEKPGSETSLELIESRNTFCDRTRDSLSKTAREKGRLARVAGRMTPARARGNSRDPKRLEAVGKYFHDRMLRHWQHISLSCHSGRQPWRSAWRS